MSIVTGVASVLIGGGLLAFIQFLINRYDNKHDKLGELLKAIQDVDKKVGSLEETVEERDAVLARGHILRFKDELYNDIKHSQEYFEQTLDDIEVYDRFCDGHPKFGNGRTKAASAYIQAEYDRLFKAHKL